MELNFWEILMHMPATQWAVVITLGIMSILAVGITVQRLVVWNRSKKQSLDFARYSGPLLEDRALGKVIDGAKDERYQLAYAARIIVQGLREAEDVLKVSGAMDDLSTVSSAMNRARDAELSFLRRWTTVVATVGASAPFVGLLGTVLGIISAFQGIAATGSGGLAAVSAGIAEALIVTALGLAVAIPATWMYNYFTSRLDDFQVRLESVASEMMDYLAKHAGVLGADAFERPAAPTPIRTAGAGVES
jgi:biopolymer transport protein ExbB/TolQ